MDHAPSEIIPLGYKRTEVGVIPEDWEVKLVSQFGSIVTGGTPSTQVQEYWNGHYPWVTPTDISETRDICSTERELTWSGLNSIRKLPADSVLVTCIASIGKNAILRVQGGCNQQINAIIPNEEHCGDFLYYVFEGAKSYLLGNAGTTATSIISKAAFKELTFPLPPLPEQRAIAEALSDADALLGALDRLIAKKRAIKQATMQQLLTGKTRLPGFSGEWEVKRLDEVADIDPENLSSGTNPVYTFNYISLEQVDVGRLLGYTIEVFSTAPSRARRILRSGDVLMSTVRPNLMAHLLYREQIKNAVCSTGFAVLRAKHGIADPEFLFAHLFGYVVNKQIGQILSGSNYPAINNRDVKMIEIPCPTNFDEQTAIAAVLSDMGAEIAALERRRDKTRQIKQGMMQQLLTGRVRLVSPSEAEGER